MNYYKILGVTQNACKKTIREAYLKKVKLYHPDLNKSPDATTKFKQIQEAYQALYNNDKSKFFYINLIFKLFPLFVVPFLFLFVVYKQYILKSHFKEKPILIYDAYGRAFLVDIHGRKFRASEFDKY
ncbi:hypothetical protein PFNF54_04508 [Plasmodium falciparum NF54]|uniref:J domain-containing protein n=1 Tax=Plasmodium falciparum (isolate NF54) TaxID=5843 RepID=W7JPB6_PLAFO|nr:hypothetical protein PFNF54_04508 [Plasmodium falciparum NF54]